MSINKQKFIFLFWFFLFILGAILIFLPIPEFISKKILGSYLVLGSILSYSFRIPLFKRDSINVDKNEKLTDVSKYSNLIVIVFGIYLILF